MTKLLTSFARRAEHDNGALQLLWTILCWAAAFGAVVVTTAVLVK
ncbi:MAG TPA: hypothetical protein VN814_22915 [Caulobacteraceae bacterium]|nr:hypothetical protein [Caulobacteraceae bacterium]